MLDYIPIEGHLVIAAAFAAIIHYHGANSSDSISRVMFSILSFLLAGVVGFTAAIVCLTTL